MKRTSVILFLVVRGFNASIDALTVCGIIAVQCSSKTRSSCTEAHALVFQVNLSHAYSWKEVGRHECSLLLLDPLSFYTSFPLFLDKVVWNYYVQHGRIQVFLDPGHRSDYSGSGGRKCLHTGPGDVPK